jgi:hypothetical protein
MKKTLLIIIIFIGLGNVNAQSDASKEETLSWLNTYLQKFSKQATIDTYGNDYTSLRVQINNAQDGLIHRQLSDENYINIYRHEMYLTSVIKISMGPDRDNDTYYIAIWGKDKSVSVYEETDYKEKEYSDNSIFFSFSNKEEALRVFKALKHLFTFYNQGVEFVDTVSIENKF